MTNADVSLASPNSGPALPRWRAWLTEDRIAALFVAITFTLVQPFLAGAPG